MTNTTILTTILTVLAAAVAAPLHASPTNDDLLFYCPFDGNADATVAQGEKTATHAIAPEFQPGVRGQALMIGGSTNAAQTIVDGTPVRSEQARNCYYPPEKNIDLQQGSVSFWLKPLDWNGTDKNFNVIFRTGAGPNFFQIYKYWSDDRFLFLCGEQEKWTSTEFRIRNWKPGQWHHVAATWSPAELRTFIDGHMVCTRKVRYPLDIANRVEPFSVGPGGSWDKAFIGHSLVDEFRIHNRPLSREEVVQLYIQDAAAVELNCGKITIGEKTPMVDGQLKDFEYAFDSTGLAAPGESVSTERSRYAVSYDRTNLYVAVLSKAPESGVRGQASGGGGTSVPLVAAGDAGRMLAPRDGQRVELFLCPPTAGKPMYRISFDPAGKCMVSKDGATGWSCTGIQGHSIVSNDTWLLKAVIPFTAVGFDKAPDGQDWRMNLVRIYAAPEETVSLAPIPGPVDDRSHFITLAFRPDAPSIRIANWTDQDERRCASDVSVQGAEKQADIRYELISNTTESYGLNSQSHPLFSRGESTPYKSPVWRTGMGADFSLNEARIVEARNGKDTILYMTESISESRDPLKVFHLYTQDRKRLFVSALRRAEGRIQARFLRPDGTCAFTSSQATPAAASYFSTTFDLDFGRLIPGNYSVRIDHLAPDGTQTEAWQQDYRIPAPDAPDFQPYVDEEADRVPAPWTAVQVSLLRPAGYGGQAGVRGQESEEANTNVQHRTSNIEHRTRDSLPTSMLNVQRSMFDVQSAFRVSTWGRTYGFSNGFLFSSLVSQGKEILASPAILRLNGTNLPPVSPAMVKLISATDVLAAWNQTSDLGTLSVSNRIQTHFDGYCQIAMTLTPGAAVQDVKSLSLDIPLRSEAATLVRDAKLSALIGGKSGAVGNYWSQSFTGGPAPFLWVGNDHVGFNWLAPNLDGWQSKPGAKHVELIRQGDTVILRLNLVDSPLTLDAPRTIAFGFTLTPSRPLDQRILRRREYKEFQLWCQPWKCFAVPDYDTADVGTIKDALARVAPGADEVFLYLGTELTSPFSAEWPWFVEEWLGPNGEYGEWTGNFADPVLRSRCVYSGAPLSVDSFFNWMQNTRRTFFEKAKTPLIPQAHSYYFDTGPQVNPRYREQAINVYRMIRRTGPNARIYAHQGWPRVMPMQHFADMIVGGEGVGGEVGQKGNYYDLLTPEMFRATFSPYIWGMKMVFLDMTVRALKEDHPDRLLAFNLEDPEYRRPLLHSYGYCIVHDVDIHDQNKESHPLRETMWAAQDALGWDENVVFHSYWDADAVKRITPESTLIMASAYTKNGKMLLAVLNDTGQEQNVELSLDLGALGMKEGLSGSDLWQPEKTYTLSPTWKDTVPPRAFRLVLWK